MTTTRSCPDWPDLMELAPDLQFKHYTVAEAKLPSEVLVAIGRDRLDEIEICCDLDRHVFYARHTDAGASATRCASRTGTSSPSGPAAAPAPAASRGSARMVLRRHKVHSGGAS